MFEKVDHMADKYWQLFNTPLGHEVLSNMLGEAKFFTTCSSYEDMAVQNFMKIVLGKMGMYDGKDLEFTRKLFELPRS